jgi:hypothetical protein
MTPKSCNRLSIEPVKTEHRGKAASHFQRRRSCATLSMKMVKPTQPMCLYLLTNTK